MSEDFKRAYNEFLNDFLDWSLSGGEELREKMENSFKKMLKEGEKEGLSKPKWKE